MSKTGTKGKGGGNPLAKTKSFIPSWVWAAVDGFFALVAGAFIAATAVQGWIATGATIVLKIPIWTLQLFGAEVHVSAATLMSIAFWGMFAICVLDLLDATADKPVLVCLLLMWSIGLAANGAAHEIAQLITSGAQQMGEATLGQLLGG